MNLVLTEHLEFVEVQGSGEEATFSALQLSAMLDAGRAGVANLLDLQAALLGLPGKTA
jgi:ribonuclease PH